MSKPTFIFVPGAWHTPSVFSIVITLLSAHGYQSHGLSLPSVGANPGLPDFSADVSALQSLINTSITAGEDIVVVLWSYGGVVGTEAVLPSMLKSSRQAVGKAGGITHLVYLAAPILPVGKNSDRSGDVPPEVLAETVHFDQAAGTIAINAKVAPMLFYNDIEDQGLVAELVSGTLPMSVGSLGSTLTRTAWAYTPATAVICEKDNALTVDVLEQQLKEAKEAYPDSFGTVEHCAAGHAPFVGMPEWVTDVLRRAAGESS